MEQVSHVGDAPSVVMHQDIPGMSRGVEAQLSASDAGLYARFFQVLSDPTRVRLLHLLLDAPEAGRTVSELVEALGAPQGRISTGLVQPYREGKYVYYRITDPRVREILALGGAVMRDHAAGIASCGVIR